MADVNDTQTEDIATNGINPHPQYHPKANPQRRRRERGPVMGRQRRRWKRREGRD